MNYAFTLDDDVQSQHASENQSPNKQDHVKTKEFGLFQNEMLNIQVKS